jgi:hypothetical protein
MNDDYSEVFVTEPAGAGSKRRWPASTRHVCSMGPINGERFRAYVEQFLAPTLKPGIS